MAKIRSKIRVEEDKLRIKADELEWLNDAELEELFLVMKPFDRKRIYKVLLMMKSKGGLNSTKYYNDDD